MIKIIHSLSRRHKQAIIFLLDAASIVVSLFIAYSLRLGEFYVPPLDVAWLLLLAPAIAIPVFMRLGLFRAIIQYLEFKALWTIAKAVSLYSLLFGMIILISGVPVPRSVIVINWLVAIVLITGSRVVGRWIFSGQAAGQVFKKAYNSGRVIIYGAGSSGAQLASGLAVSRQMQPVAFVDDDTALQKHVVAGLKIHAPADIEMLIREEQANEILLAMPSASKGRICQIVSQLEHLPVHVRTLPGLSELAEGKIKVEDIREIEIDDLLGRDPVLPDRDLLKANISGKVVMVTGAGGSIGSELCRQIIQLDPEALILYEQSEYNLYALEKELVDQGLECTAILGSVVDQSRVEKVCRHFSVDTIYHTAAYKHVPLVEKNLPVGVVNNVMGTLNTAKAAIAANVETFVLISTDKAVRPTNVMGASKRFAEMVLQGLNMQRDEMNFKTRFTMVRFGNVLGSSGSVVPYFREQIRSGGPVTVTHKDIIRYFMTIPEASQLVIQAGAMGEGGDVFVLDMGQPVKIYDLAKHMIKLSGFEPKDESNPNGDIEIKITGLRPGEKLYEELLIGDNVTQTSHPRIMRAEEEVISWQQLNVYLDELNFVHRLNDGAKIRDILLRAVNGYAPQCEVVDVLRDDVDSKSARLQDLGVINNL